MQHQWHNWLSTQALPLWGTQGFNSSRQLYHERLAFDGNALPLPELRLMVQARQIATFCQASCDGLYQAADHAHACLERVEKLYYRPDGQIGWIFSIGGGDLPANNTRDLYAHAFILFAYAWAYQHTPSSHYLHMARQTIEDSEIIFHTNNGGFLDAVPAPHDIRRQNPHMHLLEAYLTLFEISQDDFYFDKAHELINFSLKTFLSPTPPSMLMEYFTPDWKATQKKGHNRVEAGHLFEWAWLLNEFIRLSPKEDKLTEEACYVASSLFKNGLSYGFKNKIVLDAMTETGTITETSCRIWPQTELMRLLARHADASNAERVALLRRMSKHFFEHFAPPSLSGGWVDRFHSNGTPATEFMPASSLYHIYSAGKEILFKQK